ncbi:carbohydrate-binding module family 5 protein [Atractiella rhizophila]|nr:carbohydrate-binding module family 5 protein [Atractiella rhizophila]
MVAFLTICGALLALMSFQFTNATPIMDRPKDYGVAQPYPIAPRFNYTTTLRKASRKTTRTTALASGYVQVGYFPNWMIYAKPENGYPNGYNISNIPATKLSHIIYAFVDTDVTTGLVTLTDSYADTQARYAGDVVQVGNNLYGNLKQLYLLKKQHRQLKTLLSVGGWTAGQNGHMKIMLDPVLRNNFVSSCVTALEDYGFDGIDIDYEFPATAEEGQAFADTLTLLRSSLDAHAAAKGEQIPYQITAAVSPTSTGYQFLNIPQMQDAMDFFNLMAYDYAGSWSNVTDYHANLFGTTPSNLSTHNQLQVYYQLGALKKHIVMGMPLYARTFTETTGIYRPFNGVGSFPDGAYNYRFLPLSGSTPVVNHTVVGTYSFAAPTIATYDSLDDAVTKANYVVDQGLLGSMYWDLSGDSATASTSIVNGVNSVLQPLESSLNHLSYPQSQFANVRNGIPSSHLLPPSGPIPKTAPVQSCDAVSQWFTGTVYVKGDQVVHNNFLWEAKFFVQNEEPVVGGRSWTRIKAC